MSRFSLIITAYGTYPFILLIFWWEKLLFQTACMISIVTRIAKVKLWLQISSFAYLTLFFIYIGLVSSYLSYLYFLLFNSPFESSIWMVFDLRLAFNMITFLLRNLSEVNCLWSVLHVFLVFFTNLLVSILLFLGYFIAHFEVNYR